jgi:hypothetical protein
MNMGITGNFKMRFVGKPNGVFMKGAPGNFKHGEVYTVPFGHSKFKFWEMLEEEPVLKAPELSSGDDVWNYEEEIYVPEPEITVSEPEVVEVTTTETVQGVEMNTHTPIMRDGVDYSPNAPAVLEPYGTFNTGTGEVGDHQEKLAKKKGEAILDLDTKVDNMTRGVLLGILKDAGVAVKKRTRTTTLRKMVDNLEAEE